MDVGALNATAVSLLGLLEDCGPLTGGELVRAAQERIGAYWNLTRSQVYRELAGLAAAGLVAQGAPGPRDARPFRATAAGRRALREWLATQDPPETVRIGLLVVVAFARHLPPGRLREILDRHEATHRDRLSAYQALDDQLAQAGADAFVRATLAYGLHHEQAVLDWFAGLPVEVRQA